MSRSTRAEPWRHALALAGLLWHAAVGAVGLGAPEQMRSGLLLIPPQMAGPAPDGAANVVVLSGTRHSLVFGTGQAYRDGRFILDVVAQRRLPPIRRVFVPAALPGYVFGAAAFQDVGVPLAMTAGTADLVAQRCDQCLARLRESHGDVVMAGSRVPVADEVLAGETRIDLGNRTVRLIDLGWAAVPGELALFDETTATLVTAEVVAGQHLPQLHDGNLDGWLAALERIEALAPKRILPGRGGVLPPSAISCTRDYLVNIGKQVRNAYERGLSLSEAGEALRLPGASAEEARVHSSNVQILYLQLESADLGAGAR